jgi:hypothetical protein
MYSWIGSRHSDVPCSGDGTIRKSPEKMNKWTPGNAEKNKPLQKQLLKIGLDRLKPTMMCDHGGGILLYSTCSLNPVENDEPILEVLNEMNESDLYKYEIVDLGDLFGCENASETQGHFLKVLPAASHGGFFVCALRKLCLKDDTFIGYKCHKGISSDELVMTREKTLTFAMSPSTKQCCIDLNKVLHNNSSVQLVGCGVPVLYQANNDVRYILQEGCACLSLYGSNNAIPTLDLRQDLRSNENISGNKYTVSVPMTETLKSFNNPIPGMPCIANLHQYNSVLPCRIHQIGLKNFTVEFTARPQIIKRLIKGN